MFRALLFGSAVLALITPLREENMSKAVSTNGANADRVFELRTYYAAPGKLNALHARFRDHTNKIFQKHGMTIIGFWTPADPQTADNTLIYLLAFPSKEAADKSWKEFREDPDWIKAKTESEKNGKIVEKVESVFLNPTDYSALK